MENENVFMRIFETTQVLQRALQSRLSVLQLPTEITGQRLRVLWEVSHAGSLRMSELASRMGVQPRTVTPFVDALETAGFVTRKSDPQDRRVTLLELTGKARSVVEGFHQVVDGINGRIAGTVSFEDQRALTSILGRIEAAMKEDAPDNSEN